MMRLRRRTPCQLILQSSESMLGLGNHHKHHLNSSVVHEMNLTLYRAAHSCEGSRFRI